MKQNNYPRDILGFTLENSIWRINIWIAGGIALTSMFGYTAITSLLFMLSFVVTFLLLVLFATRHTYITEENRFLLITLFCIAILSFVSVFRGKVSFDYIKKYIIYLTTLISFYLAVNLPPEKKSIRLLLNLNLVISTAYVIRFFFPGVYTPGGRLTFDFSNSNFVAMWLFVSALLLIYTFVTMKTRRSRFYVAVLLGFLCYFIYKTEARNIWIALGIAAFFILYKVFEKKYPYNKVSIVAMMLYPMLFALGYIFLFEAGILESNREMIEYGEKANDSRIEIWKYALAYFEAHPIIGGYSIIEGGRGSFQLHNTHLDTLASYGIINYLLFAYYHIKICLQANSKCTTLLTSFALAGFIGLIASGAAEASLYANGMGLYIFVASFLMMSNFRDNEEGV
jgi:hypothetical protein